jgi:hypothetical protein
VGPDAGDSFMLPVARLSTVSVGITGRGRYPYHTDRANLNCAARLIGPLSWLQVQGGEEPHRFNGYMVVLLEAWAGGIDRHNPQSNSTHGNIGPITVKSVCAAAQVRGRAWRECPDRYSRIWPSACTIQLLGGCGCTLHAHALSSC